MSVRAIRIGTFAAVCIAAIAARDGAAQTAGDARRVFAGAVVAGNFDNSAWSSGSTARSGGALAVGVSLGKNFADRWSVQVEGEWPTSDQTVVDRWDYPYGYAYGGQTYTSLTRATYRTPTVAVLFGVHWRLPKRVDIAFQFGPCLRNERQTYEYQTLTNGTVTDSHVSSWNDWRLRTSVGADVAVNVTSRVAVVGQLRVHMDGLYLDEPWAGTVVRPTVGVRVSF
jgi:hypothetical protein